MGPKPAVAKLAAKAPAATPKEAVTQAFDGKPPKGKKGTRGARRAQVVAQGDEDKAAKVHKGDADQAPLDLNLPQSVLKSMRKASVVAKSASRARQMGMNKKQASLRRKDASLGANKTPDSRALRRAAEALQRPAEPEQQAAAEEDMGLYDEEGLYGDEEFAEGAEAAGEENAGEEDEGDAGAMGPAAADGLATYSMEHYMDGEEDPLHISLPLPVGMTPAAVMQRLLQQALKEQARHLKAQHQAHQQTRDVVDQVGGGQGEKVGGGKGGARAAKPHINLAKTQSAALLSSVLPPLNAPKCCIP